MHFITPQLKTNYKVARISLGPSGNSTTTGGIRTITIDRRKE